MKEINRDIITQGTPKLENMPKEAFNVFCGSLLDLLNENLNVEVEAGNNESQIALFRKECAEFQV